ncbi:MAG: helix-turn-helix domain-containing transcriptional regulator [Glycocaulis sp.]
MPLTRDFKATIKARAERDPKFRAALYAEALDSLVEGDTATAKAMLRDYVNATIGFERLEAVTGTPRKSLMRMLSAEGNPTLDKLGPVLKAINAETQLKPEVQVA